MNEKVEKKLADFKWAKITSVCECVCEQWSLQL
jgi:hypothetical protein